MDIENAEDALNKLERAGLELLEKSLNRYVINPDLCKTCTHRVERHFSWKHATWACDLAYIDERLIARVEEDKVVKQFKVPAQCVFFLEHLMYNDNKR